MHVYYIYTKHFANALDTQIDNTTQQKSMNVCTNSEANHVLQMIQLHYRAATSLPCVQHFVNTRQEIHGINTKIHQ